MTTRTRHVPPHYIEQDFGSALSSAESAIALIEKAEKVVEEVKNEALLWVYLVEWLSVTGTSLVVGFILWSMMVRRKLYREVATTGFRAS